MSSEPQVLDFFSYHAKHSSFVFQNDPPLLLEFRSFGDIFLQANIYREVGNQQEGGSKMKMSPN